MAPTRMLACAAILLCAIYSVTTSGVNDEEMVIRRFDHLKRLAEGVGWKPIVEPPEARLKVIESKARRQLQPKIEQNTQKDTGCPAGYTGVNCTSPICYNTSTIIYHDGTANMGDDIEWDLSTTCNDTTYYFPLDSFTNGITITILAAGDITPAGSLLGPKGEILPTSVLMNSAEKWQATFGSVVEQNGAGLYSFALRSEGIATCVFTVQAATVLSCDGGFVSDMRDDNVQVQVLTDNNGIERMPVEGVPSYLAFAVKDEIWPIQALSVVIYSGGLFAQVYPVSARYGCGAPNYAGAFTCTKGNFYHLKIRGIDTYGNVWQRVYYFICTPAGGLSTTLGPTGPTGPTSTLPPPTHCYNEGQLVNPGDSDAFCYCLPYFTGNLCQNKLCFNGGFLASDDECVCLDDWTGPYCTDAKCQTNTDIPFDLRFRALVFVVRTSTSMADEFTQIVLAARGITSFYTANHADYFAVYVLATFVNGTIPIVTQFTDPQAFIAALTGLTPSPGGCDDTVFTTLSTVLQLPALAQYQRSPIFVFTDGVTNDGRDQLENMFNLLSYWRGEIYTVLTDPADGCSIDTASQGYRDYQQIARFSQGLVSQVPKTAVATLVTALANNLYQMDHVLTNDLMINCQKAPVYQPFLVDTDTQAIVITATGTALSLMLTDPMMQKMSMTPILSQSGTYIWMTTNLTIGSYLLSISGASAPCQYRVMARSSLDLFFGMSSSLNSDAISPQPIYNVDSHIVAHVNGLPNVNTFNAEVTITMNDPNDNRVALFASNGVYRDGCSYFLYFGNWRCQRPFDEFYITVYGMDNDGATFQRVATGFCSAKLPPVVPPNGCLNGGVDGPNGTCVCPPYFSGPLCQTIQCLNGGTPTSGFCFCPPGFTSQFCELTMCFQINQEDPFSPNERSLTYIIHDSLRMRALIQGLQQTAAQLTQSISQQHPRWINFYQLISFNDQGYKVYTESASPSDFVAGLGALLADNKQNISVSCRNLSMFEPINYALSSLHASRNGHVFVFTCGQAAMNYETIAEMFDKVYESRTQINFIQTDSRPCGLHMNDSGIGIQMEIPLLTGGQFFPVSTIKAAQINSYVPTLYSGNLVYENSISDCTKPQSFYFPIDSHTQAFTVYTQGQLVNTGSVINSPQGTPYTSSNIINLWSDTTLNTRVDQVIRACDPSWEDVVSDGNCYKFNFKQLTWTQARDACHSEGAVLINIYTNAFESLIDTESGIVDYWTGLNDIAQEGHFVWDQLNGSIPLESGTYTNWAPGQPAADPGHLSNCVVNERNQFEPQGLGWVPTDCLQMKFSVCVKRNYNYMYEPSEDQNNVIPPGVWSVSVQTQSGSCYLRVTSQSSIQLFAEYVIDTHKDTGYSEPSSGSNSNRMIAHISHQESTTQGLEGQLQYLHLYADNLTLLEVETFAPRSGCAYEYISMPFLCPVTYFQAMVTGVDSFGYVYQRIKPVTCIGGVSPSSCMHGGAYNNGQCYCLEHYTGEFCEQAVCVNGGTLLPNGQICKCLVGFTGQFCELPQCQQAAPHMPITVDNKTFVLVLDGVYSSPMGAINHQITQTLTNILNNITGTHSQWFTSFVGVVFFDSDAPSQNMNITSSTIESTDMTDFINRISAIVTTNPYYSSVCAHAPFTGIVQALASSLITPRSEVFVLAASSAADWQTQLTPALNAVTRTHAYVNFITISGAGAPCSVPYNDPSIASMFNLAQISGGGYYQVLAADLQIVWTSLVGTFYSSTWLAFSNFPTCANITQYVQVGANSSVLTFDIFGIDVPTVNVINPNGNPANPNSLYAGTHSTLDQLAVAGMPGIYSLQVNPGSSTEQGKQCLVKVRGQSTLRVFFAFTQDVGIDHGIHSDQASFAPVAGTDMNALVATSNGAKLTYVQFLSLFDGSLLWSSPLQLRSGCAYAYISSVFTCPAPSFAVAIEGTDFEGHPIRRIGNIHCVGLLMPTIPPVNGTFT